LNDDAAHPDEKGGLAAFRRAVGAQAANAECDSAGALELGSCSGSMTFRSSCWLHVPEHRPNASMRIIGLPHGGGSATAYRDLARALPKQIELVAIQLPGRGPRLREPAVRTLPELVTALLPQINAVLDKPLAIFGHSVGGLLAFELSCALERQALDRPWQERPLHTFVSGYPAPEIAAKAVPMHDLGDAELLSAIAGLGHLDTCVELSPELAQIVIAPTRADFAMAETHIVRDDQSLAGPLSVLAGRDDTIASRSDVAGWQKRSRAKFLSHVFDGGHFFTESHVADVATVLASDMAASLNQRPISVSLGPAGLPADARTDLVTSFKAAVTRAPEKCAVIDGARRLSFRELDDAAQSLCAVLISRGLKPGDLAGVYLDTSIELVVAYLAILKAAAAFVPLPRALPSAGLSRTIDTVKPQLIVSRKELADAHGADTWQHVPLVDVGDAGREHGNGATPSGPRADAIPNPDRSAFAVTTSGTTGLPKAVVTTHRAALNSYSWRYRNLPYEDGEREACNIFFAWEFMRPLIAGETACIIGDETILDARRLTEALADQAITRVLLTPSMYEQVLAQGGETLASRLSRLRTVVLNGEVVAPALVALSKARLPHVTLVNDYSIAECHDVAHGFLAQSRPARAVGLPGDGTRIYILDDKGEAVPTGIGANVFIGGDNLAPGYIGAAQQDEGRFVSDPFAGGEARMFDTGDIGRLAADGTLEVFGRSKFMIKLRGYSIVPSAIEAVIRDCEGISAACVMSTQDPRTGRPDAVIAYVTGPGGVPDAALMSRLREHLRQRLPQHEIPSRLIPISQIPICAATGKVDRKRLADEAIATAPQPVPASTTLGSEKNTQARQVEHRMGRLWQQLLGIETPSLDDNFFDLGGHSLKAGELAVAIEREFAARCDVIDIFDHPKLAALSDFVSRQAGTQRPSAAPDSETKAPVLQRSREAPDDDRDVAVIGMACRFPGAKTLDAYWRLIIEGRTTIRQFSADELAALRVPEPLTLDPRYVPVGAMLDDVAAFDPGFWGLSRREATLIDPQHRVFLECAWHAIENAGHRPDDAGGDIGVYAGCYLPGYMVHHLGASNSLDPSDPTGFHLAELGNDKDYLASRTAYLMNLRGPAITVQTSCSTGLVAIAEAAKAVRLGECRMALAGAASITFPQGGFIAADGHVATGSGICRSFDARADGTILGNGVGVVVLRRFSDAIADGDNILAVIKGYGINNDGSAKAGYSAPGVRGQSACITKALADAGIEPQSVGYVEAHGTGTRIGDPIEVRALNEAYGPRREPSATCALGTVKPNIGHANIAAGTAGFIKTVLALGHRMIPPLANFDEPNPNLGLDAGPFYIPTRSRPWLVSDNAPRRAGVSSFGIGGTNCHVILEEAPAADREGLGSRRHDADPSPRSEVLPVSAKTPTALNETSRQLAACLEAEDSRCVPLPSFAETLQFGRATFKERRAVVAASHAEAARLLTAPATASKPTNTPPSIAFVFPGQGARAVQLAPVLYARFAKFRDAFDACRDEFRDHADIDLHDMLDPETAQPWLARPTGLQPALFATAHAYAHVLHAAGLEPDIVAGHSLGEYAAAVTAGALTLADAARLIGVRARACEALPAGAMLSVAVNAPTATDAIAANPAVAVAALNGSRETVISGPPDDIADIAARLRDAGIATRALDVTHAFHSSAIDRAVAALREAEDSCAGQAPQIALLSNLTGTWQSPDIPIRRGYWADQMRAPVRFAACADTLLMRRPDLIIEVGTGRALTRLIERRMTAEDKKRINLVAPPPTPNRASPTPDELARPLLEVIARGFEAGLAINWNALRDAPETAPHRVPLPGTVFDRQRCWPEHDRHAQPLRHTGPRPSIDETKQRLSWEDRFFAPGWTRLPPVACPRRPDNEPSPASQNILAVSLETDHRSTGWATHMSPIVRALRHQGVPIHTCALADITVALETEQAPNVVLVLAPACDKALSNDLAALAALVRVVTSATKPPRPPPRIRIVTTGALRVSDEALNPAAAAFSAAVLVLAQECPDLDIRLIDLPGAHHQTCRRAANIAALRGEVLCSDACAPIVVAVRGRHRWAEDIARLDLVADARQAGRHLLQAASGCYVITGGLGRIGLALAKHLTGQGCRVFLMSRRRTAPQVRWAGLAAGAPAATGQTALDYAALQELTQTGLLCGVASVDVVETNSFAATLRRAARMHGGISGIFHAAGLADLSYLETTSRETIEAELAPKSAGTRALSDAVDSLSWQQAEPPAFVMAFSSLAATLGGYGMYGYASANRYLDAFAELRNETNTSTPWICVNWDDWDFAYEKEQVAAYAHTRAQLAMPVEDGLAAIEAILGQPDISQCAVSMTPLGARMDAWRTRRRTSRRPWDDEPRSRAEPASQSQVDRRHQPFDETTQPPEEAYDAATQSAVQSAVISAYSSVLGTREISPGSGFFELGGDSLMAAELVMALHKVLPHAPRVRIADVLEAPTPRELAEIIDRRTAEVRENPAHIATA